MRRFWPKRRFIVASDGEIWQDPNFPDEPPVCRAPHVCPLIPPTLSGSDAVALEEEGEDASDGPDTIVNQLVDPDGLDEADFVVALMLSRGARHREIGRQFDRGPKWVQRKLRANAVIEDVADQLRSQQLTSIAGSMASGAGSALEIVIEKATDARGHEQLAASRLLFTYGLKYHELLLNQRGLAARQAKIEEELAALRAELESRGMAI